MKRALFIYHSTASYLAALRNTPVTTTANLHNVCRTGVRSAERPPPEVSTQFRHSPMNHAILFCSNPSFQFQTLLFNIPFAALQVIVTVFSAFVSTKLKLKWPVLLGLSIPPIAGASALFVLGRGPELRNKLLGCYYVVRSCADNHSRYRIHCPTLAFCVYRSTTDALFLGKPKYCWPY